MSEQEFATFAKEVDIEDRVLREQVASYEYSNLIEKNVVIGFFSSGSFLKKNKAIKAITSFIRDFSEKYGA